MITNREILENAVKTGKILTFKRGNLVENNVKIVYLNSDDVCNKDFIFETENGQKYNGFENSITFNF